MIRINADDKAALVKAAERKGQSVTSFVTLAALKEARAVDRREDSRAVHGGVPIWFRASCREAANGGTSNYRLIGRKLLGALAAEVPADVEIDEWHVEIAENLNQLLEADDDGELLEWFEEHYPKFVALIPPRRRQQFVDGLREQYAETGIEI
ncbi:MAG: DUF1778 domain-containing protein [Proteobacteria bacterium]|nr:DUF1778 domain-containing protein [Pseudomonadota bacterium]